MRCVASAAAVFLALAVCAGTAFGRVPVSFLFCYDPEKPETPATRRINTLASEDGTIDPVKWGSLILPGGGGRAAFTLALAGGSAPDIYKAWFHILRHDVAQGFVYPLDEWIDPAGVEKKDIWDEVSVFDSHVWALPTPGTKYYGILYRKDIVRAAGLDPEKPPRTWSEFRGWCRRLTCKGRRAFAVENRPWGFLPWINSARGDVVRRGRSGAFEASFDSPEAVAAARFLQSLVRDGTVRALPTLSVADDVGRLFISGEIVAVFGGEDLVSRLTETLAFPSEEIGLMPFPARDEGGIRVLQAHRHFYAMSDSVRFRPKEERDLVFKCLEALASPALADEDVKRNVAEGRAMWCLPSDLERLGFSRELEAMPPATREMYEDLAKGEISAVTEPWVGFWQGASDLMQRHFLGVLLSDAGPGMDVAAALSKINEEANSGLMFDAGRSGLEKARPFARIILCAFVFSAAAAAFLVRRAAKARSGSSGGGRRTAAAQSKHSFAPWIFLAPALVSILLWSYYPLVKGALMAFQDYRIVGRSEWVGLDNFLRVAMSPAFWTAVLRTLQYVAITLLLGFTVPIVLAVMLAEIPRGKVFFRFLYFLPHLTSALVVTLLWKMMFDPTENGILNQILASVGIARHSWLLDPGWAMVCCIIPGVWAGAGISSLIYIAALGSLPKEYYEAAAMDGAGIFARIRHVTFPQLYPLMVINFVGAFIAAFQGMGSIFLLTFGGPGDATEVLSLSIWKEAYNNLRFSTATTMAWFLGTALVGFTCLQIRFLRRVEFRRSSSQE